MAQSKFEMPHAEESERAVLGSILIDHRSMQKVAHLISHEDFYTREYQIIYRAMEKLQRDHMDIDVLTLSDTLKDRGYLDLIGGPAELAMLSNDVPTAAHIVSHAKIIAKHATLRRILYASKEIAKLSQQEADLDVLLPKAEAVLHGVTRSQKAQSDRLQIVDLEEWVAIARSTAPPEGAIRGFSTGYKVLDDMTEGFEPGEVMILTGHTKHGKSKLAANVAYRMARAGLNILYVNTEMTKLQMGRRFANMIKPGETLKGKIKLNDKGNLEYRDVITMMEKAKEWGADLVIVDHLHFFSRSEDNQTAEVSRITKEFKEAAVEYDLPLMLLAHVQQADTKKKPTLQMLKNSSSIAQDADMVFAVWRDDRPDAPDQHTTEVIRLASRSAERNHTRGVLYSDGFLLVEDRPISASTSQGWAEATARQLGERNDDMEMHVPDWANTQGGLAV